MSVSLKHKFQSPKADGTDTTIVRPSNWNDEHDLTLAAGKVLGRDTSGAGAAQELPIAVDTSGRVMLGTTTYINTWNTNQNFVIAGTGASGIAVVQANVGATPPVITFTKSRGTTPGDWTNAVVSGDNLGVVNFAGADGTNRVSSAQINAEVDGAVSTGSLPGRLVFSTTPSGSNAVVERMRIDNSGNVGIGSSPLAGRTFTVAKNITGSVGAYSTLISGAIQSDVTTAAYMVGTSAITAAASFTLGSLVHFSASQSTFGAGSAVTNQYGFFVSSNVVGATNNFGFYSAIASATGRWNFYAAGTADNYFAGNVGIGTTTPSAKLEVNGTAKADEFIGVTSLDFDLGTASTSSFEFTLDLGTA